MKNLLKAIDSYFYIYDNKGESLDRITLVIKSSKDVDIFGTRFNSYQCVGSCLTGVSFFNHSNCQRGPHLGMKIKAKDLNIELINKLETYLFEGEKITYHREPTAYELKIGEGATHYKDFTKTFALNISKNQYKKWLVCPYDGLRYYY